MRRFILALASVAALLVPARAHATAEFPQQIVTDQNITCANPIFDGNGCTICHTNNTGGLGTATKPLGVWMKQNGLTPFNDQKLAALLTQLQNESPHTTDTNCDGKPDIDQLTSCDWQSLATVDSCGASDAGVSVSIFYGCSTAPTPSETPVLPASVAIGLCGVLGIALVRARTRKRSGDRDRRSSPR